MSIYQVCGVYKNFRANVVCFHQCCSNRTIIYTHNYNLSYKSHKNTATGRRRTILNISIFLSISISLLLSLTLSFTNTHEKHTLLYYWDEMKTDSFTTKIKRQCFGYVYMRESQNAKMWCVYHVSVNNCSFLRYKKKNYITKACTNYILLRERKSVDCLVKKSKKRADTPTHWHSHTHTWWEKKYYYTHTTRRKML